MLLGERSEALDDDGELGEDDVARVAEEDEVGVVGHIARRGAEVDDAGSGGRFEAEDVDVGHDIVTALLLLDRGLGHLLIVEVLRAREVLCQLKARSRDSKQS